MGLGTAGLSPAVAYTGDQNPMVGCESYCEVSGVYDPGDIIYGFAFKIGSMLWFTGMHVDVVVGYQAESSRR